MAAGALIEGHTWSPVLIVFGLVVALAGLAIGVHAHGVVTALDGPTASWINHHAQRSHRLLVAAQKVAHFGDAGAVAMAGMISGALLSARYRSLIPGTVVVATTGAAVLAKDIMAAVIERPVSQTEIAASEMLSSGPHPFPSGHVAGTAALLGIVAVGLGARGSRALRGVLVSCVVVGTLIVGISRLVLEAHWLSDVAGGALVAGIAVTLGAAAFGRTSRARPRAPRRRVPAYPSRIT